MRNRLVSSPNDLNGLQPARETARFARRKESFVFPVFRVVEGQNARERNQRRIRGSRGGRSARQRLGNGAASRWNRSKWTRKWRAGSNRASALARDLGGALLE